MKVGDKVVVQPLARWNGIWLKVMTVSKVGRKYFQIEGISNTRFMLDNYGYSPKYKLWSTPVAWYLEQKEAILHKTISDMLNGNHYGWRAARVKLSQLEAIAEILELDTASVLSQVNEQYITLRREYYGLNLDSGALGGIGEANGGGHIEASTTSGE